MTTLLVQKLYSELSQEVTFDLNERVHIGSIIPYIYLHNAPAGTFTFEMTGPNGAVFSKSFTSSDIKTALSTTDNYAHVYYAISPTNPVQIEKGAYTFTLTASGYTPTESSFIGWIQQHENIQNEMSYDPIDDEQNSLCIRYKSYREGIR
jgi:hypothetical protein